MNNLNLNDKNQVEAWQKFVGVSVDGSFGEKTRLATVIFQRENNLRCDGKVGINTLAVAKAQGFLLPEAKAVSLAQDAIQFVLPESGPGFCGYNRERNGRDQYGTRETIEAIKRIGAEWFKSESNCPVQIGDISRQGGGNFPPHATHKDGKAFDARPVRTDSKMLPVTIFEGVYDRARTAKLFRLIKQLIPTSSILFNDKELIRLKLCKRAKGHDNHFHVFL